MKCEECGHENVELGLHCEVCGATLPTSPVLSDVSDSIEDLVQQASIPNLASLFGKAKKAGHIKGAYSYGGPV